MNTRQLSKRQREVLALITRGLSNKEIARTLAIAVPTTKIHVAAALRTINARNRTEAAFKLGSNGLDLLHEDAAIAAGTVGHPPKGILP